MCRRFSILALLVVLTSNLLTIRATAASFDGRPKLLLHVMPVASSNACTAGVLGDCSDAVTSGQLYPNYHFVYLLAAPTTVVPLGGIECGIQYSGSYSPSGGQPGLNVFHFSACGSLEFPSTGWPGPGGGNMMTWSQYNCPTGETAVAGYFYVGAYSADTLRLTVRPVSGFAKVANCNAAETDLVPADLGYAVFSQTGTVPGCNPCLGPCPGFAPGGLTAVPGCGAITLSWNAVPGAEGYRVWRDGVVLNGGATQPGASFVDPVPGAVLRCYQVSVVMGGTESALSPEACALAPTSPPTILVHPRPAAVAAGKPVALRVFASEEATAKFQWRRNGLPLTDGPDIHGTQSATLIIDAAGAGDAGDYEVWVTNECGTATSNVARLGILPAGTPDWREGLYDPAADFFVTRQNADAYFASDESLQVRPGYKQYLRWKHFWGARVDSSGSYRTADLAMHTYRNPPSTTRPQPGSLASAQAHWTPLGPFAPGARVCPSGYSPSGMGMVAGLYVDPLNLNRIFVGSSSGGIFGTTNGGSTWTDLNNGIQSMGVNDILYDANNTTLTITTGTTRYFKGYGVGVLRSTDSGASWLNTLLTFDPAMQEVVLLKLCIPNPALPQTMMAISKDTVYKTSSGFATNWSSVLTDPAGSFKDLESVPGAPGIVLVAGAHYYRSTNYGATFSTDLTSQITSPYGALSSVDRIELATSPAAPNTVWAIYSVTGSLFIVKSTDAGLTWTAVATPSIYGAGYWTMEFAVSPVTVSRMYVGAIRMHRSIDGGTTWTQISNTNPASPQFLHDDIRNLKLFASGPSDILFAATDGGLGKSTNNGDSWSDLSAGLDISQYYALAVTEADPNLVLCGAQDKSTDILTSAGWKNASFGDGAESLIDPTNSLNLFSTINGRLFRSTDGGCSWVYKSPPADFSGLVPPVEMDPKNSKHLLMGHHLLWESFDSGDTWNQRFSQLLGDKLKTIAVCYANPNVFYFARGEPTWSSDEASLTNMIFRCTGGVPEDITGRNPTGKLTGLAWAGISDIAVHPTDFRRVWVTLDRFWANQKVYYSSDAGEHWTNYSDGLPNMPANCIVYERGSNDGLYVGTDVGVYYRNAHMTQWAPFKEGLPDLIVAELEINYSAGKIRAATHARGLWESHLAGCGSLATGPNAFIHDTEDDVGHEPNVESGPILWESPDIWIRNYRDIRFNVQPPRYLSEHKHQNPEYSAVSANRPYIYAKYCNRGDMPVSGTVSLYWASASTGLSWPADWTNGTTGGLIGTSTIANLQPGTSWVVEQQWTNIPNPGSFGGDHHFCLLTRFVPDVSTPDPIIGETAGSVWSNVYNSNNIGWKNVTVVDLVLNAMSNRNQYFNMRSTSLAPALLSLELSARSTDGPDPFTDYGTVRVILGHTLFARWQAGGGLGTGVQVEGDSAVLLLGSAARLDGITFAPGESFQLGARFELLNPGEFVTSRRFRFDAIQYSNGSTTPDGGEVYHLEVGPEPVSGVPERTLPPAATGLLSCTPNPFGQKTRIAFHAGSATVLTLGVFDVQGHEVRRLLTDAQLPSGAHSFTFESGMLANGIYFVRAAYIQDGQIRKQTAKVLITK